MTTRVLVIVGASAVLAAACVHKEEAQGPSVPLVRVVTVARTGGGSLELRGSVASDSRVRLGFKQAGVVAAVLVKQGMHVERGRLVARLDDVDARSLVRRARAACEKARRDGTRAARLVEEGALATSARDDAQTQIEAAEAQLTQAEDALSRTELRAPVAGTVFLRVAEPGETLSAGAPVIVLDSTGSLVVKTGVAERELSGLRLGQSATLVPDDGNKSFTGRVTSLATAPNPADGLYSVEVTPTALPARPLQPGALLRMRFESTSPAQVVRIPLEALVHRQDVDSVFLIEQRGSEVVARMRRIEAGEAEAAQIAVRSGLAGGERIVAEGAYFLQDGQIVRVQD